jgi:tetratricopeptide (TPR) repeat protein
MTQYAALSRTTAPARPSLGERVRQLRIARGLTQTELAGERFSKEYVSQIERGKTRPTGETIEWLAARLGVDRTFLETGVSSSERERVESVIARAEASIEDSGYPEALEELAKLAPALATIAAPELELRALLAESWARMYRGEVRKAIHLLQRARVLAEAPSLTDVERADVLFRLGCCRYKLNSISTAVSLYSEALDLATRSELPSDRLRSHIHGWRSRCYRRQRDWEAAREDVEHALELAEGLNDRRTMANAYFQASLVAERTGHLVLARSYAENAKGIYEELRDQSNVGKLLNDLGALNFLLGKPEEAIRFLKDSFKALIDAGDDADAARVISSLAQVHLRIGKIDLAEEQARKALEMLGGRVDHIDEIGNAQLVLGRALLDQNRLDDAEAAFAAAESSFDQLSSGSHRAAAWIAQGDLAARRGDDRRSATLYRRAAETLQDFQF